jgi:hypothetical protein
MIELRITVDEKKRWQINGLEAPTVRGCADIDLGFSPSTNLLPIRRLSLAVGEDVNIEAAWLSFPALQFEPLQQVYVREKENIYRYESAGGRFKRTLELNSSGFVTNYPGLWLAESCI